MNKLTYADQAAQWLSRTLAVLVLMVGPGLLGSALDKRMGTSLFTPAGFLLGMVLGTVPLLILAHKLTPPARGNPLPLEDEQDESEEQAPKGEPK